MGGRSVLRTFDEVSAEHRLLIALLHPAYDSVADLAYEHEVLLEALRAGDLAAAHAAWSAHFDNAELFFADLIKERAR